MTILTRRVRGIRDTLPSGYILGRSSKGEGQVELIQYKSVAQATDQIIAQSGGGQIVKTIPTSGSGITNNGGTFQTEWNAGSVTALGTTATGTLAISSGTLDVTTPAAEWTAGSVTALGTVAGGATIEINTGTIEVLIPAAPAQEWTAGTVTALGTNASGTLSISSGTLALSGISSEWTAGTVTGLASNMAISGNTLEAVFYTTPPPTWNPADAASSKFIFSNGNLTASNNGALAQWYMARGTTFLSSGKWYAEFTCNATDASFGLMFGIANATASLNNYAGSDNNGTSYQTGGSAWRNGSQTIVGTGTNGYLTGQTTAMCIDLGANLIWWWSPRTNQWNNSGTANPATGTGGLSISAISGPVTVAVSMEIAAGGTNADEGTLNTGQSAFAYTVPSGFTAMGVGVQSAINTIGTGLTVVSGASGPTLEATAAAEWNAGSVSAISSGLAINSGTLVNSWQNGTVTALSSTNMTITSGTLNIGTNPTIAGSLTVSGEVIPTYPSQGIAGNTTGTNVATGRLGEIVSSDSGGFGQTATVTLTLASPGVVNWTAHGITGCCAVQFSSTGALPTGLSAGTTYWTDPASITTNSFSVATTIANAFAGTDIAFTGSQSGTQSGYAFAVLNSASVKDCAAIQLTAGDWVVYGAAGVIDNGGATITFFETWVNTASVTIPTQRTAINQLNGISATSGLIISGNILHVNTSATVIAYCSGQVVNGVNGNGLYGGVWARRVG